MGNERIRTLLFDRMVNEPMTLVNENGLEVNFGQVFAIDREDGFYCILRPLTAVEGVTAQTAFVFSIDENGVFRAVKDKKISDGIFAEYYEAICKTQGEE